MEGIPRHQAAAGLDHGGHGVELGSRLDPTLQQVARYVDRRRHQDQEDGELHRRRSLQCAHSGHHPRREEEEGDVDDQRQADQPRQLDPVARDVHPGGEGDREDHHPHERRPDQGRGPEAGDHR